MEVTEDLKRAYNTMLLTLKRIANYQEPDEARDAEAAKSIGLDHDEYVEMCYENVICEAQAALNQIGEKW